MAAVLTLAFESAEALAQELEANLRHGRAFVPGDWPVAALEDVTLVIVDSRSGARVEVPARVAMVSRSGPLTGAGLDFREASPAAQADLARLLAEARAYEQEVAAFAALPEPIEGPDTERPPDVDAPEGDDATDGGEALAAEGDDTGGNTPDEAPATSGKARELFLPDHRIPANVNERVRKLGLAEQLKLARTGELNERMAIERLCGKAVWDALLSNPKISAPEVARIAKMGTAPRPMIEQIVANNAWLQSPLVRRALLTNPRLSEDGAMRVLRALPKPELKLVERQRSYSLVVRNAAKKLTRGGP